MVEYVPTRTANSMDSMNQAANYDIEILQQLPWYTVLICAVFTTKTAKYMNTLGNTKNNEPKWNSIVWKSKQTIKKTSTISKNQNIPEQNEHTSRTWAENGLTRRCLLQSTHESETDMP